MTIGILASTDIHLDSLRKVFANTHAILARNHKLLYRTNEHFHVSPTERLELAKDFLNSVDVLFGDLDLDLLQARRLIGGKIPYLIFLHGATARGFNDMSRAWRLLTTADVLVANCTADESIIRKFFSNAACHLIPFGLSTPEVETIDNDKRSELSAALGISSSDNVLLYAGRIGLEKNVHTLLRVYSAVCAALPNTHLLLAGNVVYTPYMPLAQFGIYDPNYRRLLQGLAGSLGLDPQKLHFLGHQDSREIQTLYQIADVCVNMTLNHDENFGLAQVEAMACGTPVVGTNWGGLKDTIQQGRTGFKVATFACPLGVKVHWLDAAARIIQLLNAGSRNTLREECRSYARVAFSLDNFANSLDRLLASVFPGREPAPLEATPFALEFWQTCNLLERYDEPAYCRGQRSFDLYRQMIESYAGSSDGDGERSGSLTLKPDDVLCLAFPVIWESAAGLRVEDPLYPILIQVPLPLLDAVKGLVRALEEQPVCSVCCLEAACLQRSKALDAIVWLLDLGALLRFDAAEAAPWMSNLGASINLPALHFEYLSPGTDVLVVGNHEPASYGIICDRASAVCVTSS